MSKSRTYLINALKFSLVFALLMWMNASGRLSLGQAASLMKRADVIVTAVVVWLVGPVMLGSWRWWLLMKGAGIHCSFFRALRLQLVGFFFNTAMPGAVGGDIVKAIYIARDQDGPGVKKTPAMLTVLLDRIVGLMGLFLMGGVATALNWNILISNPATAQLVWGLVFVALLSVCFLAVVLWPRSSHQDPIARLLAFRLPMMGFVRKVYEALRRYQSNPKIIWMTIGASALIQLIYMAFMGFIGRIMYGDGNFQASLLAPIFPFGILVTAIPLAPGGLGVGHAAFDKLFQIVGLPGGANVFNLYVLSQLLLNLLGLLPYLSMKQNVSASRSNKVLLN